MEVYLGLFKLVISTSHFCSEVKQAASTVSDIWKSQESLITRPLIFCHTLHGDNVDVVVVVVIAIYDCS